MLELRNVQAGYGDSQVLFGVDLDVTAGGVVSLMGRNGMGKSTTIKAIMGVCPTRSGSIRFNDCDITQTRSYRIARLGVGLVPEGREIFSGLSVRENLLCVAANRNEMPQKWTINDIFDLFPSLKVAANRRARALSGGEQQMLAIARALMTNPKLLILDEATEGLAPVMRDQVWKVLTILKQRGQSILIIDKNLNNIARLASKHYVLEKGQIVWSGDTPNLVRDHKRVANLVGI
jgi:branched-chain amino acid transport system ATP-binding protein